MEPSGPPPLFGRLMVEVDDPWSAGAYRRLLWGGTCLSLGIHLAYALVFLGLGVPLLALTNGVLVLTDLGAMLLLRAGWLRTVEIASQLLILGNSSLNVVWLGWEGGFQYFILQLLPLILLGFERPRAYKAAVTALIVSLLATLFLATRTGPAPSGLPRPVLDALHLANLVAVLLIMAVQALTYSRSLAAIAVLLRDSNEKLNTLAYFDALTGLPNRRALWDRMAAEVCRSNRHPPPPGFVVCLADVDNFKAFNDRWGHDLGDLVLAHVAGVLRANLRGEDVAGRWGGEEFLILLTETDAPTALGVLDRLRLAVAQDGVTHGDTVHTVTLTLGFSPWRPGEAVEQAVSRADVGLLEGKRQGKNQVVSR